MNGFPCLHLVEEEVQPDSPYGLPSSRTRVYSQSLHTDFRTASLCVYTGLRWEDRTKRESPTEQSPRGATTVSWESAGTEKRLSNVML